jgi:hypothetical protein
MKQNLSAWKWTCYWTSSPNTLEYLQTAIKLAQNWWTDFHETSSPNTLELLVSKWPTSWCTAWHSSPCECSIRAAHINLAAHETCSHLGLSNRKKLQMQTLAIDELDASEQIKTPTLLQLIKAKYMMYHFDYCGTNQTDNRDQIATVNQKSWLLYRW